MNVCYNDHVTLQLYCKSRFQIRHKNEISMGQYTHVRNSELSIFFELSVIKEKTENLLKSLSY